MSKVVQVQEKRSFQDGSTCVVDSRGSVRRHAPIVSAMPVTQHSSGIDREDIFSIIMGKGPGEGIKYLHDKVESVYKKLKKFSAQPSGYGGSTQKTELFKKADIYYEQGFRCLNKWEEAGGMPPELFATLNKEIVQSRAKLHNTAMAYQVIIPGDLYGFASPLFVAVQTSSLEQGFGSANVIEDSCIQQIISAMQAQGKNDELLRDVAKIEDENIRCTIQRRWLDSDSSQAVDQYAIELSEKAMEAKQRHVKVSEIIGELDVLVAPIPPGNQHAARLGKKLARTKIKRIIESEVKSDGFLASLRLYYDSCEQDDRELLLSLTLPAGICLAVPAPAPAPAPLHDTVAIEGGPKETAAKDKQRLRKKRQAARKQLRAYEESDEKDSGVFNRIELRFKELGIEDELSAGETQSVEPVARGGASFFREASPNAQAKVQPVSSSFVEI